MNFHEPASFLFARRSLAKGSLSNIINLVQVGLDGNGIYLGFVLKLATGSLKMKVHFRIDGHTCKTEKLKTFKS